MQPDKKNKNLNKNQKQNLVKLFEKINPKIHPYFKIDKLFPIQEKSIDYIDSNQNVIVFSPTGSGKTLVAELIMVNTIVNSGKKAMYVVPLKALASEKFNYFSKQYPFLSVGISSGDFDSNDYFLNDMDIIIATSEKFDSLLRHQANFIKDLEIVVIDEIHLLNDVNRGPTLEVVITHIKRKGIRIIGLSATIGNPQELTDWLDAVLIKDTWRPVELRSGILKEDKLIFKPR